jgi:hypothetical protein
MERLQLLKLGRGINHPVVVEDGEEEDKGKEVRLYYGAHTVERKDAMA